jgi:hypothetical protein
VTTLSATLRSSLAFGSVVCMRSCSSSCVTMVLLGEALGNGRHGQGHKQHESDSETTQTRGNTGTACGTTGFCCVTIVLLGEADTGRERRQQHDMTQRQGKQEGKQIQHAAQQDPSWPSRNISK